MRESDATVVGGSPLPTGTLLREPGPALPVPGVAPKELRSTSHAPLHEQAPAIDYDNPLHQKWSPTFRRLVLPADPETRGTRVLTWSLALVVAGLYLFLVLAYWAPAHPGVDQNGYFVGGRQFAQTLSTGMSPASDYGFVGRMWIRVDSGENFPKYPLGLPILFALCVWLQPVWNLVNWDGHDVAHLISPVSAALATLGIFAFVRRLAGGFAGLLAMLMLGLSQVMLTLSINPNSHALGTCLTVWSFYLMVRWLETGALWRGMLCAFLLGYAFLVRYTEGLQALPLLVAMLFATVWWRPGKLRVLGTVGGALLFGLLAYAIGKMYGQDIASGNSWLKPMTENGGLPFKLFTGAVLLAALVSLFVHVRSLWRLLLIGFAWLTPVLYQTIFNTVEMGSFTSYAGTNESTGFAMDYFQANWEKMIRVLNDQGLFFIAPLGFVGLLVMFRKLPMVATILTLWFVPSVLLYTAYYWAPDQWGVAYSRFVLTELPALVIPAAWLLWKLIGDAAPADEQAPRFSFLYPLSGALLLAVGLAVAVVASRSATFSHDAIWWLTVAPALIVSALGLLLLASALESPRPFITRQLANPVPRVAIGAAAFVACAIASYRCVNGTEWGQRINSRASVEAQSYENKNLAALGKSARAIIPEDAVVFSEGERMHHLQWLERWEMFSADAFNPDTARRLFGRQSVDENDPDPMDPGRLRFLRDVYANKDQATLTREQNRIMSEAIRAGRRVFLILTQPTAQAFVRKFVASSTRRDGMVFDSRLRDTVYDTRMPRSPDDFLEPNERPKQPVGRGGRPLSLANVGKVPSNWQIIEILEKAPPPSTQPASVAESR